MMRDGVNRGMNFENKQLKIFEITVWSHTINTLQKLEHQIVEATDDTNF